MNVAVTGSPKSLERARTAIPWIACSSPMPTLYVRKRLRGFSGSTASSISSQAH